MKLGILYTGGTIGCIGNPLSPMTLSEFKTAFNNIITPIIISEHSDFEVDFIDFGSSLDSTNLQPSNWCDMAKDILENYDTYGGFMVLHGTDTMAWTASALSFLLTGLDSSGNANAVLSKPVIVTGAQLPLFCEGADISDLSLLYNTDAFQNVCGAIESIYSGVPEVGLYFDNKLLRGNRTIKTNASEFDAFSTPNLSALGEYGVEFKLNNQYIKPAPVTQAVSLEQTSVQALLSEQLTYITSNINNSTVIPFNSYPAFYDDTSSPNTSILANMLNACIDQGVNGLVLESYGEGNFPSGNPDSPTDGAIYQALEQAHENNTVILDCTQVIAGTVNSTAYESGSWLSSVGSVGSYDMTPIAGLTKLIILDALKNYSTNNWQQADIETLLQSNIAGEIMNVNVLDCRENSTLIAGESISTLDGGITLINDYDKGPLLLDSGNNTLWQAIDNPIADDMPGRLIMQSDGNLVFYNSSNTATYASDTVQTSPATSKLILSGDSTSGVSLYVYYYAKNVVTKTLFTNQS